MITLSGVTKRFASVVAVDGISLTVNEGEIFGLVGPDGAGKTTAIRMMLGILEASAGAITVLGQQNIEEIKGEIGYVPQKFSLYGDLTVFENIRLIGSLYGANKQEIDRLAQDILTFTNLWAFKDRLADNLSGGMKQKLALAAGLMHKPRLFFLDEPTAGVDPVSRREFWQMLYRLHMDGMTIVVSTPYMDEAELCTRIAFMNNGKIVSCATPEAMRARFPHRVLELKVNGKDIKNHLGIPVVLDVNSFGDKYHLAVNDPEAAMPQIQSALAAAGKQVESLQEIAPTLEDVFVALADGGVYHGGMGG